MLVWLISKTVKNNIRRIKQHLNKCKKGPGAWIQ